MGDRAFDLETYKFKATRCVVGGSCECFLCVDFVGHFCLRFMLARPRGGKSEASRPAKLRVNSGELAVKKIVAVISRIAPDFLPLNS